jgi:tRNA-dihydrouridine synthase
MKHEGTSLTGFWQSLPQPIIGLAPMDGVTDAAFRLLVACQGAADVSFTEFTSVVDVCRGPDYLLSSLMYHEVERPAVAQLYGKDPELFYQAAHVVCELGFDGLDINMGCPSRNVASSGSGAGLIRTPALAQSIMRAARQGIADWAAGQSLTEAGLKTSRADLILAMNRGQNGRPIPSRRLIPLSVKTRIGYDSVVVEQWIGQLLRERPAVISIHGRTLEQMYRGQSDWSAIERAVHLAQGTGTLILGNGDVQSLEDAVRRVREHAVHGVLVGRSALGSPWFFNRKEVAREAFHGRSPIAPMAEISVTERFRIMLEHARQFEAIFGQSRFSRMRKHLGWYCKGFHRAASLRARMVRASSSSDVEQFVSEYWSSEANHPQLTDNHSLRPDQPPVASSLFSCA